MNFDIFIEFLKNQRENPRIQIMNPKRLLEMQEAYNALTKFVKNNPNSKMECKIHDIDAGAGVIRIETDDLIVTNIQEFIACIKDASNFEIYPLKNGRIRIAVMFYDVMVELNTKI